MLRNVFFGSLMGIGLMLTAGAHASPLVTNGGFETGDFTGWTNLGDGISIDSFFPNTGSFDAAFGTPSLDLNPGTLSQTIPTTAGASYDLSFALQNEPGSPLDTFTVSFGSFSTTITGDQAAFAYLPMSFSVPGADVLGSSTALSFQGFSDIADWNLDGVSLVCTSCTGSPNPVPAPPTELLFASGLLLLFGLRAVRRRKSGHTLAAI